jgi:DASH complex subunit DAM1
MLILANIYTTTVSLPRHSARLRRCSSSIQVSSYYQELAHRLPKNTMSQPRSHPLRRISTGSLSNLARSQEGHPSSSASPSGLDFLTGPLLDLSDEAASLASNVQAMNRLHESLGTFNEAFAGYLYALRMNAFCVEWTEVRRTRDGETVEHQVLMLVVFISGLERHPTI